jgi:hypothetical protein
LFERLELFIGLGRNGKEFEFKGYQRQKIVLEFGLCNIATNANPVIFQPSREIWGFADEFYIAGSVAGPSIAKSNMLHPIYIGAAREAEIPPKTIAMSRKSAIALMGRKPIEIN